MFFEITVIETCESTYLVEAEDKEDAVMQFEQNNGTCTKQYTEDYSIKSVVEVDE